MVSRRVVTLLLVGAVVVARAQGAAAAQPNRWTAIGPYAGGGVVVAPSNPNILFSLSHGVFKSINGGASWHHLYPRLDGEGWSLAVDPHDASRVYLATADKGVWTSSDGGISWLPPPPTFAVGNAMVVAPTNSSVIYAGLYKSVDAGLSWQATGLSQASGLAMGDVFAVRSLAVDPLHSSTVYAGIEGAFCGCGAQTSSRGGVFKSLDGGLTWAPKDNGLPTDTLLSQYYVVVDPSNPAIVYLLVGRLSATYRSTDGGESWAPMGPGGSTLSAGPGGAVYTDLGRSADHGVTWTAVTAPPVFEPWLVADPVTPLTVYSAGLDRVLKSVDGGASWQLANGGLTSGRITAFAVDPSDPRIIYASNEFHLFKTTQGGGTWTEIDQGLPAGAVIASSGLAIDPLRPSTVYAVFYTFGGNGVAKSVDGGTTWQVLDLSSAFSLVVDTAVPPALYTISSPFGGGCNPARSRDEGATWSCLAGHQDANAIFTDPLSANVLYVASVRSGFFFKSVDGGVSWHRADRHGLAKIQYDSRLVVDPTNDSHLLLTVSSSLYESRNGAASWARLLPGPGTRLLSLVIDPRSPSHLYALTYGDSVLSSGDGGLHWTELDPGRPPFSGSDVLYYPLYYPQGGAGGYLQLDPQDSATLYLADYGLYRLTQSPPP